MTDDLLDHDELDVVRRLQNAASSLPVTDTDLVYAEEALHRRLEPKQSRASWQILLTVAAAVLLVVGVAGFLTTGRDGSDPALGGTDQTFLEGDEPTLANLAGLWRAHDPTEHTLLLVGSDGRFRLFEDGNLDPGNNLEGTLTTDDRQVTLEVTGQVCLDAVTGEAHSTLSFDGALPDETTLNLVSHGGDEDAVCAIDGGVQWTFDRVTPERSPVIAEREPDPLWYRPSLDGTFFAGTWLQTDAPGIINFMGTMWGPTGTQFSFWPDGDLFAEPSVGIATYDEGRLTLTFTGGACQGTVVVEDTEVSSGSESALTGDGRWMRGTITQDDCAGEVGADWSWQQLAPAEIR